MTITSEDMAECVRLARAHVEYEWKPRMGRFTLARKPGFNDPEPDVIESGWWSGHVRIRFEVSDGFGVVGWISMYRPEEGGKWCVGKMTCRL